MVDRRSSPLERECAAWCRYLADVEPSAALVARYVDAHARGVVELPGSECAFDRALVSFARGGTFRARLADVHARLFRRAGLLRRKLVLALALLEVDAASHRRVDSTDASSRVSLILRIGAWCLRFAALAVLGIAVFLPLRAALALFGARGGRA